MRVVARDTLTRLIPFWLIVRLVTGIAEPNCLAQVLMLHMVELADASRRGRITHKPRFGLVSKANLDRLVYLQRCKKEIM